ncbi:MAG: hypothetical protein QM756_08110 [Polyangiaceae bacterium]
MRDIEVPTTINVRDRLDTHAGFHGAKLCHRVNAIFVHRAPNEPTRCAAWDQECRVLSIDLPAEEYDAFVQHLNEDLR